MFKMMKIIHYKNYLNKLNSLLEANNYDYRYPIEELPKHIEEFPIEVRGDILFNAGGVLNHELYFENISPNKNIIPNKNPIAAGIHAIFPCSSAISIDGIISDHTDAAIITPDANPNSIFSIFLFNLFFIKNTVAAPNIVPKNGIDNPVNICIFFLSYVKYNLLFFYFIFSFR